MMTRIWWMLAALAVLNLPVVVSVPLSKAQITVISKRAPTASSGAAGVHAIGIPPIPEIPYVTLYDQYNNAGTTTTASQKFVVLVSARVIR